MEHTIKYPHRIGGWLWLLGLFLLLNPIRILIALKQVSLPAANVLASNYLAYAEVTVTLCYLVYAIMVPIYFFRMDRRTPIMIMMLLLVNLVFVGLVGTSAQWLSSDTNHNASSVRLAEFVIGAMMFIVWTLYLMKSERVKDTFN